MPHGGVGYGVLRYLGRDAPLREELRRVRAEVSFNYLGQFDQLVPPSAAFGFAAESPGATVSRQQRRCHLLDINGLVSDGRLRVHWVYSEQIHQRATVDRVAHRFLAALRELIAHCCAPEAGGFTPSDFPLAHLDQRVLDRLAAQYRAEGIEDLYPLSPLQQGMSFHTLSAPSSGVFVTQVTFLLGGDVKVDLWKRAWQRVLERHPILRTAVAWQEMQQVVCRRVSLPCTEQDWRSVSPDEQDTKLEALLRRDRATGFDLTRAPLMRLTMVRTADDRYNLIWTHHHLLLDGWSFPLVLQEVVDLYNSFCQDGDLQLEPRPPYREYIGWLQRRDRTADERFWRRVLAGFGAATVLSIDTAPGGSPSEVERLEEQILSLSERLTTKLGRFAQRHRLTLNTLVQGAWALLLARYSGEEDVVFGTTVSGRPPDLPGVEKMLGLFINGLPMRVRLAPDTPVVAWLQGLQAQQVEMREYEGSSLVQIQGWSDVPRGSALFESTVVFENYPLHASLGSLAKQAGIIGARTTSNTSSPLHLQALPGARLTLRIVHDVDRFETLTIRRMLEQLEYLLQQCVDARGGSVGELSFVTAKDAEVLPNPREPLTDDWGGPVHRQFSAQAERLGDRVAVVDREEIWTYRQLDTITNQLANYLLARGVQREEVVAIYGERAAGLVQAVLGVMKAGAAFMILDPSHPGGRLIECLKMAKPCGLIRIAAAGELPREIDDCAELSSCWRLTLPAWDALVGYSSTAPGLEVNQDQLAYVTFTSGSSGKPKGVLGRHGPLSHFGPSLAEAFRLTDADRFSMLSALSHDPLPRDMCSPLQLGGTLCIPDPSLIGAPETLAGWMRSQRISVCNLTPAMGQLLTQAAPAAQIDSLRFAFFVGEVLTKRAVAAFRRLAPAATCVNLYGATETQQALACHVVSPPIEAEGSAQALPVGYGMAGVQLLVLNSSDRLAGVGEVGEICFRSPYLAKGYLGDEPLTLQRFAQNPYSGSPADRIYRTGDLGRYAPDGQVVFLGRRDDQVKIRGFRIEPAEVEAALLQHQGVSDAVVVPTGNGRGERVLAAYVVGEAASDELRRWLKTRLPHYMVPAHFVALEQLPRTASGKIDRRALSAAEPERPELEARYVGPRTPVEETLAQLYSDVLHVEKVGYMTTSFISEATPCSPRC